MVTPKLNLATNTLHSNNLNILFRWLIISMFFMGCTSKQVEPTLNCKQELNSFLDNWHLKASNADADYFNDIAHEGAYIGTANEEVWTKKEFVYFSKPYFDKGKAWDFKPYDRNIYLNESEDFAWFNEKLETWMGVCRGSGILQKTNSEWKIYQYTLSVAVPNEKIKEVISVIGAGKKK